MNDTNTNNSTKNKSSVKASSIPVFFLIATFLSILGVTNKDEIALEAATNQQKIAIERQSFYKQMQQEMLESTYNNVENSKPITKDDIAKQYISVIDELLARRKSKEELLNKKVNDVLEMVRPVNRKSIGYADDIELAAKKVIYKENLCAMKNIDTRIECEDSRRLVINRLVMDVTYFHENREAITRTNVMYNRYVLEAKAEAMASLLDADEPANTEPLDLEHYANLMDYINYTLITISIILLIWICVLANAGEKIKKKDESN
ncbi:hypothetical protein EJ576_21725 [Pseudomonas sp. C 49-2]|uniref:hypothetical protein n=1 Tax=Pseudomonas sp. C 49-2 TaxID=2496849 RepID=UPI000F84CD23|nr:hypothetical protein [Pseudomonas sp. C 49-2]RTX96347.1 hypothetical protein EJ576_21725 [Pseudomonas sp. C 49-2]